MIKVSKCKKFLMSDYKVYSVDLNESFKVSDLGLEFWFHLMKENSISLVEANNNNLLKINKLLNELVFRLSDTLKDQSLIFEYHKINKSLLLNESLNFDGYVKVIAESWDFISGYLVHRNILSEQEKSFWEKTKDLGSQVLQKTKSGIKKVGEKIKSGFTWIKEKGIDWFFEGLRAALYSWGGTAVQIFLASAGSLAFGMGPTINFIVWAAMLCYDLYLGFAQNKWNWVNIIVDILGTFTAGPGAKIAHLAFKSVGLVGTAARGSLSSILQKLATSKSGQQMSGLIKNVVSGIGTLLKWVTQAITWIGTKLGIKKIVDMSSRIKSRISEIVGEMGKSFGKTSVGQVTKSVKKGGQNIISSAGKNTNNVLQKISQSSPLTKASLGGAAVYGINKSTGADTQTFGGAFTSDFMTQAEKEKEMTNILANSDSELPDDSLAS